MVAPEALQADTTDIAISLTEEREPSGWNVTVVLTQSGGRSVRTLRAESCEAGLEAAALVAALAIGPEAQPAPPSSPQIEATTGASAVPDDQAEGRAIADPSGPSPSSSSPDAGRPAAPSDNPPPRTRARTVGWAAGVGAGPAFGVTPATAGMLRAHANVEWSRAAIGLGASYAWPSATAVAVNAGARLQLWSIDARGCYVVRPGSVRGVAVPLCGIVRVGAMHGVGQGLAVESRQGTAAWTAAGPLVALRWISRRHVGAFFAAEGVVVLARPTFVLEQFSRVCCRSRVAALLIAGVAFGG